MISLDRYLRAQRAHVERALRQVVPLSRVRPRVIHQAIRYSLFAGGKRLRPILCLAACEAVGGSTRECLWAACGLECIHTYSLIHDDLPSMDNADTRRGRPTSHRQFGEDIAILAGDALLSLGFELLARGNHAQRRMRALRETAHVIGTEGLIGGQVMDLAWQRQPRVPRATNHARRTLHMINANKTAKLMALSVKLGGLLGGGTAAQLRALARYGFWLGMTFQMTDDALDGEGVVRVIGQDRTRREAHAAAQRAQQHLRPLGHRADRLHQVADAIVARTS